MKRRQLRTDTDLWYKLHDFYENEFSSRVWLDLEIKLAEETFYENFENVYLKLKASLGNL